MAAQPVALGLRANWQQFSLLVIVNAFVGLMVGLERTVVPLLAEEEFGLAAATAATSFIVSFGVSKAISNFLAGRVSDLFGRRRVLVIGWLMAVPVPLMIIFAPGWWWIVAANVLLGINQGFTWSTTVIMKIDLVGPARRGLAMGLNEAAGYGAVALAAILSGYVAGAYGLRPAPLYMGIGFAVVGLVLSWLFVRETQGHAQQEATAPRGAGTTDQGSPSSLRDVFVLTSWRNRTLFSVSQAGLVNNLNDGLAWGVFPLFFATAGLGIERIGVIAAVYPAVWGLSQLGTGVLSDYLGRKWLVAAGMWLQAGALWLITAVSGFSLWTAGAVLLGLGTALVYPALLAVIGDVAHPQWRASSVGIYRFWRDSGYAVGALLAGAAADALGFRFAIALVAGLTFLSGVIVAAVMQETRHRGREVILRGQQPTASQASDVS